MSGTKKDLNGTIHGSTYQQLGFVLKQCHFKGNDQVKVWLSYRIRTYYIISLDYRNFNKAYRGGA